MTSLAQHHRKMLAESGIDDDRAAARAYETVNDKGRLIDVKIAQAGRRVPGLLVPLRAVDGSVWGYQFRPDYPRADSKGREVKYETPVGQRNGTDVPPGVGAQLGDPKVPLFITEGVKKADCAVAHNLCCIALPGVWSWRGTNDHGGKTAVPDWHDIALNDRPVVLAFDGDVARKQSVRKALKALAEYLQSKGAKVRYLHLPDTDDKTGLDDWLVANGVEGIGQLVKPDLPPVAGEQERPQDAEPPEPQHDPVSLDAALSTFTAWLPMTDVTPVVLVAAAVVANLATGEPLWLLLVGPPSCGKTEILSACAPLKYLVPAATVTEAALLSGTSKREIAKDATGGLLRQVGDFGILLAKDFTSVLSQNRDVARSAIAALREVYDGSWSRPVGTDGGRVLTWKGKCGFIGGVTPSIDRYGSIINALGDRFLLIRLPDPDADKQAAAALRSAQQETQMREELVAAMCGLITGADLTLVTKPLTDEEANRLSQLAMFTARARTAVERDGYTGDLLVMPQPEGPARLVKTMRQLYGGLLALGVDAEDCWPILSAVAVGCVPAIRVPLMRALLDLEFGVGGGFEEENGGMAKTAVLAERTGMVTKTASRVLDDLALLGIATRKKSGQADNSADLWGPTDWLTHHGGDPLEAGQKCTYGGVKAKKNGFSGTKESSDTTAPTVGFCPTSDTTAPTCSRHDCHEQLVHPKSIKAGMCYEHRLLSGVSA